MRGAIGISYSSRLNQEDHHAEQRKPRGLC